MSETVRVEFDPPRECQETEKAWRLSAEGQECLFLPKSQTKELERDGKKVRAAIVSSWLAEQEGFSSTTSFYESGSYREEQTHDSMTRNDWFTLGMAMAMVIRGDDNAVWEARKLARKLQEES